MKTKLLLLPISILGLVFLINLIYAAHTLPSDLVDDDTSLLEGMGDWANDVTEGAFWTLMLLGFCVTLAIATMNYGVSRSVGFAGLVGLFGSISLAIIGWMPWWIASLFIVIGSALVVLMIKSK